VRGDIRKASGALSVWVELGRLNSERVEDEVFRLMVRLHFVPLTIILSVVEG